MAASKEITTKQMIPGNDLVSPLLLESSEYRRRADSDRADAIAKIDRIDADIMTLEAQLAALRARRADVLLIVQSTESTLVIIPGPANGGEAPSEPEVQ